MDGSVLVTGASSGIGAAIAVELAQRGFGVGCLSRRGTTPSGSGFVALTADVTDEEATGRALEVLVESAGPLCGVVNAAGFHVEGPSRELSIDTLRAVMETNFFAAVTVCRQAHPHFRAAGGGLIVNIGSFYEHLGVAGHLAYSASKAAIGSLTRCLAVEWATDGICVLDVAPGYVHTGLNDEFMSDPERRSRIERRIPVRRLGQPEEVARFVGSLVADRIGFLTGSTIYIDGGQGISL